MQPRILLELSKKATENLIPFVTGIIAVPTAHSVIGKAQRFFSEKPQLKEEDIHRFILTTWH